MQAILNAESEFLVQLSSTTLSTIFSLEIPDCSRNLTPSPQTSFHLFIHYQNQVHENIFNVTDNDNLQQQKIIHYKMSCAFIKSYFYLLIR